MTRLSLAALALLLAAVPSEACRCRSAGDNFAETILNTPDALVVEVEIVDQSRVPGPRGNYKTSMRVLVLSTVRDPNPNQILKGTVLNVIGSDGINCNEGLGNFEPTKRYRLALEPARVVPGQAADSWDLSNCGVFWEPVAPKKKA